jgi:hypothetical protein
MKIQVLLLIATLLTGSVLYAPAQDFKLFYQFIEDSEITPCVLDGTVAPGTNNMIAKNGYKFKVERVMSDHSAVVISFLEWRGDKSSDSNLKYVYTTQMVSGVAKADENQRLYFKLSAANLANKALPADELPRAGFLLGAITTPIKMRFGDGKDRFFDLTSNVNLGVSFGYRMRLGGNVFVAPMTGVSITSVPMTTEDTKGTLSEATNVACLSIPLSVIFFIDNFQLGISGGLDIPSGKVGRDWIYRDSPWLGIGLGYNIFELASKPATQKNRD